MKLEDIHKSKTVRGIVIGIAIVVVLLAVLSAGISIGYHKARFSGNFGDNYERNFLGSRMGYLSRGMSGGHGATGKVVSINLPNIVIAGNDNLEKTVFVSTSTLIRELQESVPISSLKVGDYVVVLGNPNTQGVIESQFIRVMPSVK